MSCYEGDIHTGHPLATAGWVIYADHTRLCAVAAATLSSSGAGRQISDGPLRDQLKTSGLSEALLIGATVSFSKVVFH